MTMILGCLTLAACNPNEIPGTLYDGPDFVYFQTTDTGTETSNVTYSWPSSSTNSLSVTRTVLAVGQLVDYDRTFKITAEIDPSMEYDYDISRLVEITEDTYTIKGGEISTTISFKLLNDGEYLSQFKTKTIATNIKIVATDDFAWGFTKQTLTYNFWISGSYQ